MDLSKLDGAGVMDVQGRTGTRRCVVIPVDGNPEIYVGGRGVYLNLLANERHTPGLYGDTHIIKGGMPKEMYMSMGAQERMERPILGHMSPFRAGRGGQQAGGPQGGPEDDGDLPF